MSTFIIGVAAAFVGLIWLGVLIATSFNLVAVSIGLLAVLYILDTSRPMGSEERMPLRSRRS